MVLVLGVLVLELGSHDEELREETAEATHAGEVIRIGAAGVTLGLVNGAEEGLAAMEGSRVGWGEEISGVGRVTEAVVCGRGAPLP